MYREEKYKKYIVKGNLMSIIGGCRLGPDIYMGLYNISIFSHIIDICALNINMRK